MDEADRPDRPDRPDRVDRVGQFRGGHGALALGPGPWPWPGPGLAPGLTRKLVVYKVNYFGSAAYLPSGSAAYPPSGSASDNVLAKLPSDPYDSTIAAPRHSKIAL